MSTVLAKATSSGIDWDAAQVVVGGIVAVFSLVPLVFWFVERRDRKAAEAEMRRLRDGAQISHVRFRRDSAGSPPGAVRWRVSNDSSGPLHHVQMSGKNDADGVAPTGTFGDLGPGAEAYLDCKVDPKRGRHEPFLLVYDAEWRLWRVPCLGRPELIDMSAGRK